ncbi:MAG: site-2 protease family protein, partial [Clostridia bacterium]|nr:site-2 protease family protein [Clostridia bacterium]
MLFSAFKNGFTAEAFIQIGLYIVVIMFSLSFHELSHGYVAYRCGDATARNLGRLTLNPLSHLNPIGTIMMLVFGFGYATPVPVNPRNFNHYKRDIVFVSLAGPLSNVI